MPDPTDPNDPMVTVDPTPGPPPPAPAPTPPTDQELLDAFHAKLATYSAAKSAREAADAVLAAAVKDQADKLAAEAQAKADADAAGEAERGAVAAEEP
jgi:hypothetical protein